MTSEGAPGEGGVRRCFVHIGLPKTGTTYLQGILWGSRDELLRQGVTLLPHEDGAPKSYRLTLALRGRLRRKVDGVGGEEVLDDFRRQLRAAASPHVLLTQEQLAAATREQVMLLFGMLHGFEVHVVVTVRSLARQVPSAWQERVKAGYKTTFSDFAEAARARGEAAEDFWAHHELTEVLQRWASDLPPERVHVVTVPSGGAPSDVVLRRFCRVLGVDSSSFDTDPPRSNQSIGAVQAELIRRVSAAHADQLPSPRGGFSRAVKGWLAPRVLARQEGVAPALSRDFEPWCRDVVAGWVEFVRAAGYDVVGDLAELEPLDGHFAAESGEVSEDQLLASALEALATIIEMRNADAQKVQRLSGEVRRLRAELASLGHREEPGPTERLRTRLRRR